MIELARRGTPKPLKKCLACGEELPITEFYISHSPLHKDGKVPWCKNCIIKNSILPNGELEENSFKRILRQIDKPYYKDLVGIVIREFEKRNPGITEEQIKLYGKKFVQIYFTKQNSLTQYSNRTYEDSEKEGFVRKPGLNAEKVEIYKSIINPHPEPEPYNIGDFEVTDEIQSLFGYGYDNITYKKMYDKYEKLKMNYIIQTNLHQEALATYVRFKVKEEDATACGNVDEAKKWYDAAQNAADKAKLSPKQLSKEDLQKGLNSFSEISQALEQAVDIIEILPRYKNQPADSVDFNIWCYINYARRLKVYLV